MQLGERVFEFSESRKTTFDGKGYVSRLPSKIIRFLEERNVSVEDHLIEGIWKLDDGRFAVLQIFGEEPDEEKNLELAPSISERLNELSQESEDEEDFVVLRDYLSWDQLHEWR